MSRKRHVTASELAECCVCEQRVLFDRTRGCRRTLASQRDMAAGGATHAALHCAGLREISRTTGDGRCFVATALWGPTDTRTLALRVWRDRWLLPRWWGPAAVRLYYALSPWFVRLLTKLPWLRAAFEPLLSAIARRIQRGA